MINPQLDSTIERYETEIEKLKTTDASIDAEQVLEVLNVRNDLHVVLKSETFIPTSRLKQVLELDAELRKQAVKINQVIKAEREGVYGLRRAFVIAGSQSQVISLWKVADDATKDFMVAYYDRLLSNKGRSEALRQTQLEMLRGEQYHNPYYWAAFIPSGDWTPMDK
ncbi:CHAT domain-containing protein [Nostoc sp. CCY0012]|uniref:CHAT domain-containing protein n=1 Tax=Nostoc sp. CCY0012 TaxID=1056123 RepID=UPI0039C6B8D3